jgi:hypothetical protein
MSVNVAIVCRARLLDDTSSLLFQSLFVKSDCIVVFAIEKTGRAPLTDKEKLLRQHTRNTKQQNIGGHAPIDRQ